jgi:hypothetical protein
VLDTLIPAAPLHTVESVFGDPYLIRQGGWSEAGTGPGSLMLVTGHGAGLDDEPDHRRAVLPGRRRAGWPPGGAGRR